MPSTPPPAAPPARLLTPLAPLGIDFGGSLIKIALLLAPDAQAAAEGSLHISSPRPGVLHLVRFASNHVDDAIEWLRHNVMLDTTHERVVPATGGGAHNSEIVSRFQSELNVRLEPHDELESLIVGLNTYLVERPDAAWFTFGPDARERRFRPASDPHFPYLIANVGSGVSIIRVDSPTSFTRVSGTSLGGGTFVGLCRALTQTESFEEILEMSDRGTGRDVDLTVGDIYGGDYTGMNLPATLVASSFGKAHSGTEFPKEEVAASLLFMIMMNIAQIAYLNARIHQVEHIVFTGSFFVRGSERSWLRMSQGLAFWSGGSMKALFAAGEGFLGAIGALQLHLRNERRIAVTRKTAAAAAGDTGDRSPSSPTGDDASDATPASRGSS